MLHPPPLLPSSPPPFLPSSPPPLLPTHCHVYCSIIFIWCVIFKTLVTKAMAMYVENGIFLHFTVVCVWFSSEWFLMERVRDLFSS